ncbi:MAG: hypothetical protein EOO48_06390 [Flavobacterium sp.]|nr:MAG: hypothetical protein EOO48_06390 [Flavobacterium sp.]
MKSLRFMLLIVLFFGHAVSAQSDDTPILKLILQTYYKSEKPIYKGRNQLLFLFCDKANNNEEIFETVNQLKLPANEVRAIRSLVASDTNPENWSTETIKIFADDKTNLSVKVNGCLSLDEYHEKQKRFNLNNQRLMIISKPIFFAGGSKALVKVVFYRNIEHNNGSILVFEKQNDNWIIKDSLNPWST